MGNLVKFSFSLCGAPAECFTKVSLILVKPVCFVHPSSLLYDKSIPLQTSHSSVLCWEVIMWVSRELRLLVVLAGIH